MSKYTPEKTQVPVGLDEIGMRLSLLRLPDESLNQYRRRLLLQGRDAPNPTIHSAVRTLNRLVGVFEERVFRIDLVMDSEEEDAKPLAPDPRIEVDAGFLRVWSNYAEGDDGLELEINLHLRDSEAEKDVLPTYFLRDVKRELDTLSFINVSLLDTTEDWETFKFEKAQHLRIGNSDSIVGHNLLQPFNLNVLSHTNINDIIFSDTDIFVNEVSDPDDVLSDGDYFVDRDYGILISYNLGGGHCTMSRRAFPFDLWWQPVTVFELNDPSIEYMIKDNLINDSGLEERLLLNSFGAEVMNDILSQHPLTWGE